MDAKDISAPIPRHLQRQKQIFLKSGGFPPTQWLPRPLFSPISGFFKAQGSPGGGGPMGQLGKKVALQETGAGCPQGVEVQGGDPDGGQLDAAGTQQSQKSSWFLIFQSWFQGNPKPSSKRHFWPLFPKKARHSQASPGWPYAPPPGSG